MKALLPLSLKYFADCAVADANTLALRSGILPSRVERILSGRQIPTPDEIERLLRACACAPSPLTEQGLRGILSAAGLPAGLALLPPAAVPSLGLEDARLSVDKLSLTFDPPDVKAMQLLCEEGAEADIPSKGYGAAYSLDGLRVDCEPKRKGLRSARIELNPARLLGPKGSPKALALLRQLAPLISPEEAAVTRIDVAVDMPVLLHNVQGFGERARKLRVWFGPEGIESMYSGAKGSACQLCIYDKDREQRERRPGTDRLARNPKAQAPRPWTRFEARLKPDALTPAALPSLPNPFKRLRLFTLRADGLPFAGRLLVEAARFYGLPALKGLLPGDEYKGLLADLEASDAAAVLPHPREVFAARWPSLVRSLLKVLRLGGVP